MHLLLGNVTWPQQQLRWTYSPKHKVAKCKLTTATTIWLTGVTHICIYTCHACIYSSAHTISGPYKIHYEEFFVELLLQLVYECSGEQLILRVEKQKDANMIQSILGETSKFLSSMVRMYFYITWMERFRAGVLHLRLPK